MTTRTEPEQGPSTEIAGAEEVSATLNAICAAAISTWRSGDAEAIGALAQRLSQREAELASGGRVEMGAFFGALAGLLLGIDPNEAIRPLVEPFRQGFRAVAADMLADPRSQVRNPSSGPERADAGPEVDSASRSEPESDGRPATAPPSEASDWVAALAAHVAAILKARDRETALGLAGELEKTARQPGMDPDAAAYLMVILGILRGEDVRRRVLGLVEPYRSAYASLQALMRGADPLDSLLDRLVHNAALVAKSDNPEARAGLDAVLQGVAAEAEGQELPELARLVGLVRSRLQTSSNNSEDARGDAAEPRLEAGDFDAKSAKGAGRPNEVRFSDPRLQSAWLKLDLTLGR